MIFWFICSFEGFFACLVCFSKLEFQVFLSSNRKTYVSIGSGNSLSQQVFSFLLGFTSFWNEKWVWQTVSRKGDKWTTRRSSNITLCEIVNDTVEVMFTDILPSPVERDTFITFIQTQVSSVSKNKFKKYSDKAKLVVLFYLFWWTNNLTDWLLYPR